MLKNITEVLMSCLGLVRTVKDRLAESRLMESESQRRRRLENALGEENRQWVDLAEYVERPTSQE